MAVIQLRFRTAREWWDWYSNVYLYTYHWLHVVRPAVWRYRKGVCCFCGRKIEGTFNCHHGPGMYRHLGEEHLYLDRMFVAHPGCHDAHTLAERAARKGGRKAARRPGWRPTWREFLGL